MTSPSSSSASPPAGRSRNPWPWAIVAFFVLFIGWTVGFVLFSLRHPVDLVRSDYYAEELRHQDAMDRHARTQPLQGQVSVHYVPGTSVITVALPPDHAGAQPEGLVYLYRPSAARLDRRFPLALDAAGRQTIPAGDLSAGLWRVRLTWTVAGQQYAYDQDLVIGPKPAGH